jgi:MinD-like ATPase involved in chromosome partitioning or flagellar assembly
VLNRLGFSLAPNAQERAVREDEHAVSRHWPGPRTVAVVNGKGGAGKTPATVLLSAVFAQYGGAGVLAWDNNQTRGTLGWRTETGAHDRTLLELLPQTQRLLGAQGQSADLAHFVHHQPQEKYDVLRSKPIRLAHENRLSPDDVDAIHAVAAKFYRLIIIDSGNDESDPMWLRMIELADQIVVATTTRDDHAEAGALLLEALEDRDERSARLARESVVVVSQADPKASSADVAEVVAGYQPLARDVVQIPFDREMVDGHLRLRALAAPTQRAWLSAAAAVARGF